MATKKNEKTAKPVAKATKPAPKAAKPIAKPVAKPATKPVAKPATKVMGKPITLAKPAIKVAAPAKGNKPSASGKVEKKVASPQKLAKVATKAVKKIEEKAPVKKATPVQPVAKPATTSKVQPQKKAELKKIEPAKKTNEKVNMAKETKKTPPQPETPAKRIVVVPVKKAIEPKAEAPKVASKSAPTKKAAAKSSKPVVIPQTSTDVIANYNPDFGKSVLDTPEAINYNDGPLMRYSDAELKEFRDLINKKIDAAKKELGYLQGLITRRDEMGGDETDNRYMTMEDGGMSMEREQLSQMASRQITFIDHLEKAIMRIENKTYGICRVTGRLIDKARLRAVPHATLSMEAKLGIAR